jgi:hypothetical protein
LIARRNFWEDLQGFLGRLSRFTGKIFNGLKTTGGVAPRPHEEERDCYKLCIYNSVIVETSEKSPFVTTRVLLRDFAGLQRDAFHGATAAVRHDRCLVLKNLRMPVD